MINLKPIISVVTIPVSVLLGLTCLGILINFLDNFLIIAGWWAITLGLCALLSCWAGFRIAKNKLSLVESGVAGAIVWLIPGTVGLVIYGISQFISAVLWGAVEGYETVAFFIGAIIIVILLGFGACLTFLIGMGGGWLGKRS